MWKRALVGILTLLLIVFAFLWTRDRRNETCFQPLRFSSRTLILDAGHGGEDGGAVSVTGTHESQLNLEIVLKLQNLCGFFGVPVELTRDGDYSLKDPDASTLAKMKRSDLMNRVAFIEDQKPDALISIHQNIFTKAGNKGLQVFYAPTANSDQWGQYTQQMVVSALQPENNRQSKQITDDIYLMNHISCPAILIECGFISNPEEAVLLESDSYQSQLALAILSSYMTFSLD